MLTGETPEPYRVLEKMGEGGMGKVYRARDITRDGQRILIDKTVGQAPPPPITIIQNWKPRP